MSNRAYIGIYVSPFLITLLAFKSLYLELSYIVYFLIRKPEVFCLSVIPNISKLFILIQYHIVGHEHCF